MDIPFSFEGVDYIASGDFYQKERVVLPNKKIIDVEDGWSETSPPTSKKLREVGLGNWSISNEVTAKLWHAALARRA